MSAKERRLEAVTSLIEILVERSRRGVPIIVEGSKDVRALRLLGVQGPIFCVKSRRLGLFDFLQTVSGHSEIIVLTDFDKEGRALARRLRRDLSQMRIKADIELWKQLKALTRCEIVGIESLKKHLERSRARLREDTIGPAKA